MKLVIWGAILCCIYQLIFSIMAIAALVIFVTIPIVALTALVWAGVRLALDRNGVYAVLSATVAFGLAVLLAFIAIGVVMVVGSPSSSPSLSPAVTAPSTPGPPADISPEPIPEPEPVVVDAIPEADFVGPRLVPLCGLVRGEETCRRPSLPGDDRCKFHTGL